MEPYSDITVKIPVTLYERLKRKQINVDQVISDALRNAIKEPSLLETYNQIPLPAEGTTRVTTSDIPTGSFMNIPNLSFEDYERIVNEENWEYLDGMLIHHSPESNFHNALIVFLTVRARSILDPHQFLVRINRIGLSIGDDRPEPDFMVFERTTFRCKTRKDNSSSEIVESPPILVIEVVSGSSIEIDAIKKEKFLAKGVKELWQVLIHETPLKVLVHELKDGRYECRTYSTGEIRSQVLPEFAVVFDELENPDTAQ